MKAAASGSAGKSLTSPWRMAKCRLETPGRCYWSFSSRNLHRVQPCPRGRFFLLRIRMHECAVGAHRRQGYSFLHHSVLGTLSSKLARIRQRDVASHATQHGRPLSTHNAPTVGQPTSSSVLLRLYRAPWAAAALHRHVQSNGGILQGVRCGTCPHVLHAAEAVELAGNWPSSRGHGTTDAHRPLGAYARGTTARNRTTSLRSLFSIA